MQGRHTNGIKKFPEQTSAQRTNIVTRCGAVVQGKPTLVLIVGMKNDPNWWLGNYFPFGEDLFLGVMASCWFQGGYRSIQASFFRIILNQGS